MLCPKCGKENPEESKFCAFCGETLNNEITSSDNETLNSTETDEFEISSIILEKGQKLGNRYTIIKPLGEGGFGKVYLVEDNKKDKVIVIKFLRPELAMDPVTIERFKGEIRIARKISHPNIVYVYDFAKCGSTYYISMEYIEGSDLRKILQKAKRLKIEQIRSVIWQICLALDVAHSYKIIHQWEGLGRKHRHGNNPIEQHAMIELVMERDDIKT